MCDERDLGVWGVPVFDLDFLVGDDGGRGGGVEEGECFNDGVTSSMFVTFDAERYVLMDIKKVREGGLAS